MFTDLAASSYEVPDATIDNAVIIFGGNRLSSIVGFVLVFAAGRND